MACDNSAAQLALAAGPGAVSRAMDSDFEMCVLQRRVDANDRQCAQVTVRPTISARVKCYHLCIQPCPGGQTAVIRLNRERPFATSM